MRYEAGREHQVDRTIAEHLVGNMDVAAFRIARDNSHPRPLTSLL